jgi:3-deoxy-7-phosphoheptulonate synthase
VHDPSAAQEYACWLAEQAAEFGNDLLLVMRAYVEKPRTAGGWRGLVADPWLDGSCDMVAGLDAARALLIELAMLEVPAATEWVDPRVVPYLEDCVTFGMIGARTTQSQPHRQLASGLQMPVGFKNSCDGDVQAAVDACRVAAGRHVYLGMSPWDGGPALVRSAGNPDSCVVLRGGWQGPNYQPAHVRDALARAGAARLPRRVIIDASHGNCGKDPRRQPGVALTVAAQVAAGERGIHGMMLESFLVAGRQEPGPLVSLIYGQSVTGACIGTADTRPVLETLAEAVRARRAVAR